MSKKKKWPIVLTVVGILGVAFILGPRPEVKIPSLDLRVPPINELESWLAAKEKSEILPIKPGLEKQIIWAQASKKNKTPLSVVYLPGYSASKGEIMPVPEIVARTLGANLYYTRLKASGQGADAYKTVTPEDWLTDAVEALQVGKTIGDKVILISTSTGGSLSTWLTTTALAQDIKAQILVSPNFGPRDGRSGLLLWPWGNILVKLVIGDYRVTESKNPLYLKYWDPKQASESLITMGALAEFARTRDSSKVTTPTLLFYSLKDKVVNSSLAFDYYRGLNLKYKQAVEVTLAEDNGSHVLAGDAAAPSYTQAMIEKILVFLDSLP